jgi:hypothetical protein
MSDWGPICAAPQYGEEVGVLLEAQSASSNTPNPFAPELTYTLLSQEDIPKYLWLTLQKNGI